MLNLYDQPDKHMNATAVVGLGNPFVADEGIGIRLVSELTKRFDCSALDVFDLGTASFRIVHIIENHKKVIIIDCALMGEKPGTIKRFTYEQAKSVKNLKHHSLHEGDLFEVIAIAAGEDKPLPEIIIYGVEPVTMDLVEGLSPLLEKQLSTYLSTVAQECGIEKQVEEGA
jgi:hydrogenase maturation protease